MTAPTMSSLSPVTVVLPVYNSAHMLERTVSSVLAQKHVVFELIIVDDGSDLETKRQLTKYVDDSRVTLIEQENRGITAALIVACNQACYPYIARIDVGDSMQETRLNMQAKVLDQKPDIGLVCSSVSMFTEEGYPLFNIDFNAADLLAGFNANTVEKLQTPFHASVMFRRSVYQSVGGYRPEFYFAQDMDLWSRMVEISGIHVIDQPLTHGLFSAHGISGQYAEQQQLVKKIIAGLITARRSKQDESTLLAEAKQILPPKRGGKNSFPGFYFIGKCLLNNRSPNAIDYLGKAVRAKPWSAKAWIAYIRAKLQS